MPACTGKKWCSWCDWKERERRPISLHSPSSLLQFHGLNPIGYGARGSWQLQGTQKRWEETTVRKEMRKASLIFTKAVVRWQLLRCRTVQDERHCLARAHGHRAADRHLLVLNSHYSESTHSQPTFWSVWPCLPRLQTKLLGHWSRTKRVGQFGRGSFDVSTRRLDQSIVFEIMSLYAVFVCNVSMLQIKVPLGLSIKMMHYGGERVTKKSLKLDWMTTKGSEKSSNKPQKLSFTMYQTVYTICYQISHFLQK